MTRPAAHTRARSASPGPWLFRYDEPNVLFGMSQRDLNKLG
ncbi:hypothetical protein [Streptomyces sp. BK79]